MTLESDSKPGSRLWQLFIEFKKRKSKWLTGDLLKEDCLVTFLYLCSLHLDSLLMMSHFQFYPWIKLLHLQCRNVILFLQYQKSRCYCNKLFRFPKPPHHCFSDCLSVSDTCPQTWFFSVFTVKVRVVFLNLCQNTQNSSLLLLSWCVLNLYMNHLFRPVSQRASTLTASTLFFCSVQENSRLSPEMDSIHPWEVSDLISLCLTVKTRWVLHESSLSWRIQQQWWK